MASVWKHPQSANWFARYRGPKGKTVNKSTGTPDKVEAERIASSWEIAAARERERAQAGTEISPCGLSDAIARAERLARQGRLDHAAAREIVNSLLRAAGKEHIDAVTSRTWCTTWSDGKAGSVTPHTAVKYASICREWLEFLGPKADQPLETVEAADVIAYRNRLAKGGLAAPTITKHLSRLFSAYQTAVDEGRITRNPFFKIPELRDSCEDPAREPFTAEEVAAIVQAAEGEWRGLIILAASSGLRLMDAAHLTWKSIDLEAGIIRLTTSKTKAKLTLPIHPAFAEWLQSRTRGIGAAPVFPELATVRGTGKLGMSAQFKLIMQKAGVASGVGRERAKGSRGRSTSRKSFHSFRHFVASRMAAAGIRLEVAKAVTGHTSDQSHAGYVTADLDTLREAVRSIPLAS